MRSSGFTLLELMIVVAVIAIVAAVAIPNLQNARKSANESYAISTLRTSSSVSEQYRIRFGSYPAAAVDLVTAGYIPPYNNSRYLFTYVGGLASWTMVADPTILGGTGDRFFFIDESGVIRYDSAGPAGPTSTPIE